MPGSGDRIDSRLRRLASRLLGAGRQSRPLVLRCQQSFVQVEQRDPERVILTSLLDGSRLCSVPGVLEPALARTEDAGVVRLRIPLQHEGQRRWLKVQAERFFDPGLRLELRLVRASAGAEGLDFVFRGEASGRPAEMRLRVQAEADLPLGDFEPVEDLPPLFGEMPSPEQVAAYLRACMDQRRSPAQILADLQAHLASPQVRAAVELVWRRGPHMRLVGPEVEQLSRDLASRGRSFSPLVLAVACLAAELEMGRLGPEELSRLLEGSLYQPAPETLAGFRSGLEKDAEEPAAAGAIRQLCLALRPQPPLRILADLAAQAQGNSARLLAPLLIADLRDPGLLEDPSQAALAQLLAAAGRRRLSAPTLAGLCLFVEVELGLWGRLDIQDLLDRGLRPPTSPFALVAVAGACDLQLHPLRLTPAEAGLLGRLCPEGMLVRGGPYFSHLRPGGSLEGQDPAEVLAPLPSLEGVAQEDLSRLRSGGRKVYACYASRAEHRVLWALQAPEGHHFQGRVLARLAEAGPLEGRPAVTAWTDSRGHLFFREHAALVPGELAPCAEGTWTGRVVQFPETEGLPERLEELTRQELVGLSRSQRLPPRFGQLQRALQELAGAGGELRSLQGFPRLLSLVMHLLASPELLRRLAGVADEAACRRLLGQVRGAQGGARELWVHTCLLSLLELSEGLGPGILCLLAEVAPGEGFAGLEQAAAARLAELAASPQTPLRWCAVRVLGTRLGARLGERALAVLQEALADASPSVSARAARSLAALALQPWRPLAPLAEIRPAGAPAWVQEAERRSRVLVDRVRGHLLLPGPSDAGLEKLADAQGRPKRARIAELCRLLAGLDAALEGRGATLEVRRGEDRQRFEVPPGASCGPWEGNSLSPLALYLAEGTGPLEICRLWADGQEELYHAASARFRPLLPELERLKHLEKLAQGLAARFCLPGSLEPRITTLLASLWTRLVEEA